MWALIIILIVIQLVQLGVLMDIEKHHTGLKIFLDRKFDELKEKK